MDPKRQLRQHVDELFRSNKNREFTIQEVAGCLDVGKTALSDALDSVARYPFSTCQSFDTSLPETVNETFERHRCNHCNRNFHAQRQPDGEYFYVGMYTE